MGKPIITLKVMKDWAANVPPGYLRRTNPPSCSYKAGKRNCIIGRLLADLGLPLPTGDDNQMGIIAVPARKFFTPAALKLADKLQLEADLLLADGNRTFRRQWGDVLQVVGLR